MHAWDFSADACKAAKDAAPSSVFAALAISGRAFYANEFGGLGCYLYGRERGIPGGGQGKGTTYFGFGAGTGTNPVNPDGTYMSLPEHLPDLGPPEEGRTAVPGYRMRRVRLRKGPRLLRRRPVDCRRAAARAPDDRRLSNSYSDPVPAKPSYSLRGSGYELGFHITLEADVGATWRRRALPTTARVCARVLAPRGRDRGAGRGTTSPTNRSPTA